MGTVGERLLVSLFGWELGSCSWMSIGNVREDKGPIEKVIVSSLSKSFSLNVWGVMSLLVAGLIISSL